MKNMGKLKILDTFYTLYLWKDFEELQEFANKRNSRYLHKNEGDPIDGFCDVLSKEIHVFTDEYTHMAYFDTTLRHEIAHAYLYEVAYAHYDDEELIDKIAKWTPKIMEIYEFGKGLIDNARTEKE